MGGGGETDQRRSRRDVDLWAAGLVVVFTGLCIWVGLRADGRRVDVDEVVYLRTLQAMHHGQGYYQAMRRALVLKEGVPPTQFRSIRPPTLFLIMAVFPAAAWRWVVGVVYLACLVLAWRLARPLHPLGGPVAVVLVGCWLLGAAPLLFLHAELWGLPWAFAALLAARHRRWAAAAVLCAVAVTFRELYGALFLAGLAVCPRRRPWLIAGVVLGGLGALHVALSLQVLAAHGSQPALGGGPGGMHWLFDALSPSDRPLGWLIGAVTTIGGSVALARSRLRDPADRLLAVYAAALIPLILIFGRNYWVLCVGPLLAAVAPGALRPVPPGADPDEGAQLLRG